MKVLFLFGEICSGKSTYSPMGKSLTIPVSSAVRRLVNSQDRDVLQSTKHLDAKIADVLIEDLWHYNTYIFDSDDTTPDYIIIDGIRQYSILQALEQYITKAHPTWTIEYKWLHVDRQERKRRFEARQDAKDTLTFEEAEKRDNQLGLSELFSILQQQSKI